MSENRLAMFISMSHRANYVHICQVWNRKRGGNAVEVDRAFKHNKALEK